MKKLFDNPYFVGLLVAIALFVVFKNPIINLINKVRGTHAIQPTNTNAVSIASRVESPLLQSKENQILPDAKIEVNSIQWILKPVRNPFQRIKPPETPDSSTNITEIQISPDQPLILTAIVFEKNKKLAVINNRVIEEGETIAGFKVETIERDFVILSGYGSKRRLNFGEGELQKKSQQPQTLKEK